MKLVSRYIHDDSETTEDEVELKVTDGMNSEAVSLLIQVSHSGVIQVSYSRIIQVSYSRIIQVSFTESYR